MWYMLTYERRERKNNEPGEKENVAKAAWQSPGTSKVINSYQCQDCACDWVTTGQQSLLLIFFAYMHYCSQERQHYYKHRDLAQRNKREYMSIIIDGMDQSKTNLPHFTRERKSGVSLWRLRYNSCTISWPCIIGLVTRFIIDIILQCRTHLTGAINHGAGVHTYIDLLVWPHDANLVINILLDVINRSAYLPPVLFLQLDNTARENKNQFILAFMAYLIQIELFSEVYTH